MVSVLARRAVFLVFVLLGVSLLTFILAHMMPVDPAQLIAGPHATAAQLVAIRHQYGLDQPVVVQYVDYLKGLLQGDMGISIHTHRSVAADLGAFLPATMELATAALVFAVGLGLVLGTLAAYRRNSWLDHLVTVLAVAGLAMPAFWLGLLSQWLFYDVLGWLPQGGRIDLGLTPPPHMTGLYTIDSLLAWKIGLLGNVLWHLILPSIVLGCGSLGVIARMVRASVIEAMQQDYTRTARAKGLSRPRVVVVHALKNSLMPTITIAGLQCGYLLSGTILVETVFSWPGIGLYASQSILGADYAPIVAITLVIALLYVLINTVVDLAYAAVDPRVRYR
jgi:peptide/nickel transport system permease protein